MEVLDDRSQMLFKESPTVHREWTIRPHYPPSPKAARLGFESSRSQVDFVGSSRAPGFQAIPLRPGQRIPEKTRELESPVVILERPIAKPVEGRAPSAAKAKGAAIDLTLTDSEEEESEPQPPVRTTRQSPTADGIWPRLKGLLSQLPPTPMYEELKRSKATQMRTIINREEREKRRTQGWLIPESEELPALPPAAVNVVREMWKTPDYGETVAEAGDIPLRPDDLRRLKGTTWLNDECINGYLQLVQQRDPDRIHVFSTFFYASLTKRGYESVQRWTRRFDLFAKELILIPVHLGMHWTMSCIDFKNKHIVYIDSFHQGNSSCLRALWDYLEAEHMDKKKCDWDSSGWTSQCLTQGVPKQFNGYDCGVFTCVFGECLARRAPFSFSQADMPYFRYKITHELVTGQFIQQ